MREWKLDIINSQIILLWSTYLTEYTIAASAIFGLSLKVLKFPSAIKHTGADIIVANKKYRKTRVNSAGYSFITWACKMPQNLNLAYTFVAFVEFAKSHAKTPRFQRIASIKYLNNEPD